MRHRQTPALLRSSGRVHDLPQDQRRPASPLRDPSARVQPPTSHMMFRQSELVRRVQPNSTRALPASLNRSHPLRNPRNERQSPPPIVQTRWLRISLFPSQLNLRNLMPEELQVSFSAFQIRLQRQICMRPRRRQFMRITRIRESLRESSRRRRLMRARLLVRPRPLRQRLLRLHRLLRSRLRGRRFHRCSRFLFRLRCPRRMHQCLRHISSLLLHLW